MSKQFDGTNRSWSSHLVLIGLSICTSPAWPAETAKLARSRADAQSPERRAIAFLADEVPRWPQEHQCFSCHNNGDAARALYVARQLDYPVPDSALESTTKWLLAPSGWKENKGDQEFSDQQLANLQFASALRTAIETGAAESEPGESALAEAAALVHGHQSTDGCWQIDGSSSLGSPATYGRHLATAMGIRILKSRPGATLQPALQHAQKWLRQQRPANVMTAAAILLGVGADPQAAEARQRCLQVIKRGEAPQGGWGPYVTSRPEPFDTALALLALAPLNHLPSVRSQISRGRKFLIDSQHEDGSWTETTRPADAVSYAQRLSTCGWATLALLATVEH